jgi:NTE family protein
MMQFKRINKYLPVVIFLIISSLFGQEVELYRREKSSLNDLLNRQKNVYPDNRPKIGLVLSGGGARGIAHVGVLKGLEDAGIPIDLIVGSSMGSVVGGFYAAGYDSRQLEEIVGNIEWTSLFSDETERENLFLGQKIINDRYLFNIRFDGLRAEIPTSISGGQKILNVLSSRLMEANFQAYNNFDNLMIPFRAVATDLITGRRLVIGEGDLAEAINASTAVPLLFAPVEINGMLLVDGGLRANLPVDVARDLGMDYVIAVDITSPLRTEGQLRAPWEIADQVTTIMMSSARQEQLEMADLVIAPDLEGIGSTDFNKIGEMVERGYESVRQQQQVLSSLRSYPVDASSEILRYSAFESRNEDDQLFDPEIVLTAANRNNITSREISRDVDRLFLSGDYRRVSAGLDISAGDTTLVYRLQHNPELKIVKFNGNTRLNDSTLYNPIASLCGNVLNARNLAGKLEEIRTEYQRRGYSLMRFSEIRIDESGELTIGIDEGVINRIQIEGNEKSTPLIILREFPLEIGDVFDAALVRKGIDNIYTTQLYDKVSVNLLNGNNEKTLVIKVKEKKYLVLRVGGKIDTDRKAQSYYELTDENFLGRGAKLALSGRYGVMDQTVALNFRTDRIFSSFLTFEFRTYYDRTINPYFIGKDKRGQYSEERTGSKLIFGQQLRKLGQLTVELRLENVADRRDAGLFDAEQKRELRTLALRSVTDKRDRISFTRDGIYNNWYWESGNELILESQVKFTKAMVNLEGYYTYADDHTLHIRGLIGLGDRTLPFSEFFRMGGLDSFFGLVSGQLAGRQMIQTNFEYRYHLPYKLPTDAYLGIRYDLGGIWTTPNLVMEGDDFFYGAGMWFGIDTIIGPLVLAYGYQNPNPGLFYLSLGHNF